MPKFNIQTQAIPTVASAYADIIGTTDNQIVEIKNELIVEDNNQHFQIHEETIEQLAERIAKDGQLSPCIVAPLPDGKYELIDGRHRRRAVIMAGLPTTKCIIKTDLSDQAKRTIRLTSNLIRNNDYLPSELAFAYRELAELEDMKTISEETNLSKKKIYRYIRLTYLIEPLLKRVDGGSIPVIAAVELSYLTELQQRKLFEFLLNHSDCKITTAISREIKENPDDLEAVFYGVEDEEVDNLSIQDDHSSEQSEKTDDDSVKNLVDKALEPYQKPESKRAEVEYTESNVAESTDEVDNLSTEKSGDANEQKKRPSGSKSPNTKIVKPDSNEADEATEVDKLSTQEEDKQAIEPNARFSFEKDDILYQDSEGNPHNIKEIDDTVLKHICEYVIEESRMDYYVFRFAYDARDILSLWKQNQIRSYHGSSVSERDNASGEFRILGGADWNYSSKHIFRIKIEGQFYFFLHTMLEKTVRRYLRDNYTVERIKEVLGE